MLWGGRLVALFEVPAVPRTPLTSGPATSVSGPSAGAGLGLATSAVPGPFTSAVPGPFTSAVPDAPTVDPTTAAPDTGFTTAISPSRATTSVPWPGSTAPPRPDPTLITGPPSTPDTTTDPAPPRIVGQDASPPRLGLRGCLEDRAVVRVTLAAEAPATAVILSWEGAGGSGSMPMLGAGAMWSGSLGPFDEPGSVQWSVTVSNAAGSITGPAGTIVVASCTVPGTIG